LDLDQKKLKDEKEKQNKTSIKSNHKVVSHHLYEYCSGIQAVTIA
jgi:hypothetical protein